MRTLNTVNPMKAADQLKKWQQRATKRVMYMKQRVPGAQSEGVIHPSEPMKQEELKIEQSDPHSSVDGA